MNMPFYVSPEQVMKDRADYARKGIARGRSLVALECARRRADRRREPEPHALQDQRDLRPHRVRRRSASTTSSRAAIGGVRHADLKGYQYSREDVTANGARQRVRADARPGLHPRDEAVRGRDPRGQVGAHARRAATSCSTSSTTARSWTSRASPCSAARPSGSPTRSSRIRGRHDRSGRHRASARRCSAGDATRRSPRRSSRSRCSTGPARRVRSAASSGEELDDAPELSVPDTLRRRPNAHRRSSRGTACVDREAAPTGRRAPVAFARDRLPRERTMERRIFGLENEYGVTCTLRGQRRLSPDEVARYLFRRVVSWGRSSNVFLENGARLYLDVGSHPEYATPECDSIHDLVVHDKAGERILESLVQTAEQRLREEGIRGEVYLFKNNTDSAGQLLRLPRELSRRARRRLLQVHRRADPVPRVAPGLRGRRQGAADRTRRDVLHRAAGRAHLGRRLERDHAVAPDHQHPRRAARRRRAVPPACT